MFGQSTPAAQGFPGLHRTSRSGGLHAALDRTEAAAASQGAVALPTGTQAQALHQALFGPRGSSNRGLPGNHATVMYRAYDELPTDKAALAEGVVHHASPAPDMMASLGGAAAPWQADVLQDTTGTSSTGSARIRMHSMGYHQQPQAAGGYHGHPQHGAIAAAAGVKPTVSYSAYLRERGAVPHGAPGAAGAAAASSSQLLARRAVHTGQELRDALAQQAAANMAAQHQLHHHQQANATGGSATAPVQHPGQAYNDHMLQQMGAPAVSARPSDITAITDGVMQMTPDRLDRSSVVAGSKRREQEAEDKRHMHPAGSSGARTTYYSSSNSTSGYYECEDTAISPAYHQNGWPVASPFAHATGKRRATGLKGVISQGQYVYTSVPAYHLLNHWCYEALDQANEIMSKLTIPGGMQYVPVDGNSYLFKVGVRFNFTSFSIALGSSYFQRLLRVMPHLEYAVRRCSPRYDDYLACLPPCSQRRFAEMHREYSGQYEAPHVNEVNTLASIQFTCVYLATKVVDRMPMQEMLCYILTKLFGSVVTRAQAYDIESRCLDGLRFRLGPYFKTDDLTDDWPY